MLIRLNIERLREVAAANGDTSDALIATRTGIHFSTIWRLAQPDSSQEPKVSTFRALGRPYGLTVDDLILDDTKPEPVAA